MTRKVFDNKFVVFLLLAAVSFLIAGFTYWFSNLESTSSPGVYNNFAEQANCTGSETVYDDEGGESVRAACTEPSEITRAIAIAENDRDHPFYKDEYFTIPLCFYLTIAAVYCCIAAYKKHNNQRTFTTTSS